MGMEPFLQEKEMEVITCCCHQRAKPHTHALDFQIHDSEATGRHQLFQLLSQLQGKRQSARVSATQASECPT
jgi:hypothetical protein